MLCVPQMDNQDNHFKQSTTETYKNQPVYSKKEAYKLAKDLSWID